MGQQDRGQAVFDPALLGEQSGCDPAGLEEHRVGDGSQWHRGRLGDSGGQGMRRIGIIVQDDGNVILETQGFKGKACLEEAQQLLERLEALGLDSETLEIKETDEIYVREQSKTTVTGSDWSP